MKELQLGYTQTGLTLYALIREFNTGQIYNGATFETYNSANIGDYDIALAEQSPGFYVGDFPAIDIGVYGVIIHLQRGIAPSTTDYRVGTGYINWNGETVTDINSLLDIPDGVEDGYTLREALRLVLAALAGKLSGAATTTVSIRDVNDDKDRIVATVDDVGNRTAITLDPS